MLQDEVILDLDVDIVKETNIKVNEEPIKNITIDETQDVSATINVDSTVEVRINVESLADVPESGAKISRKILFLRNIIGRRETFGQASFSIHDNIQTIGTASINPSNHNLVGIPIVFGKAVSAKKTTFGQTSFIITNNIRTEALGTIGSIRLYGSGLYGSDTYGATIDQSVSFPITFGSTISGNILLKQTSVAQVSLASHSNLNSRTDHAIVVKARTISGSTGRIKAALYEGTTNRSGDLQTPILTNSLMEYSLDIPVDAASTITDYSNLSIKFWGYDQAGNSLVFEVAEIYLVVPVETNTTKYGVVSRGITFTKSVSGVVSSKKTSVAEISLASHDIPSQSTNHSIKVRARTTSGSTGVLKMALYEGTNNRSGDLITPPLTNVLTDYTLVILDALAATIADYSNLSIKFWGYDQAGNALVFEVANIYLVIPTSIGNTTKYGAVSRGITFTKAVSGVISSKKTSVAEISLASHGTPSVRTDHSIEVRARTTSGSTGVIKAALYEGSTLRSGAEPLQSSALTNSLADYSLAIPDASAATITDYSNLSIKFWGHDSAGNALVFEIADIYLKLPPT